MKTKTTSTDSLRGFAERLSALMPCFMRAVVREERNYLARGLITLPQIWALSHLSEHGATSMRDLTQVIALRSSTVTSLMDRLVKLGLVRRWNSESDRRQVLADITAKGREVLKRVRDEKMNSTMKIFKNVTARERTLYLNIMEKVVRQLLPDTCLDTLQAARKVARVVAAIVTGGVLMCGRLAAAEDAAATNRAYTLDECVTIGLERAVTVANARRDEQVAGAKIRQVRSQLLPQVTTKAEYRRLDEVESVDLGQGPVEMGQLNNYSASADASQLLFSGGSVQAALAAARYYRDRTQAGTRNANQQLVRDIRASFYNLLLLKAKVRVEEESVEQLQGFADQTEAKFKNETASEFDMLSARVRLANEVPQLIKARRDLEVAREAFKNLIHADDPAFDVAGELTYAPANVSLEQLQAIGLEHRPELVMQQKIVDLWRQDVRAERGNYWPTVRARASYSGQNPGSFMSSEAEWEWGWDAGVTAEWNVWDSGLRGGKVMEKALEMEKAKANLDELKRSVLLDVKSAYLDLRHAAEAVAASRNNVELAEKSLEIARTRYNAGLSTYLEFTDNNLALSQARLIWFTALNGHMQALAQLQFACGLDDATFKGELNHE